MAIRGTLAVEATVVRRTVTRSEGLKVVAAERIALGATVRLSLEIEGTEAVDATVLGVSVRLSLEIVGTLAVDTIVVGRTATRSEGLKVEDVEVTTFRVT